MRRYFRGGDLEVPMFCFWDGRHWFMGAESPEEAMEKVEHGPAMQQSLPWCGMIDPQDIDFVRSKHERMSRPLSAGAQRMPNPLGM
jgi:hypothetical protein